MAFDFHITLTQPLTINVISELSAEQLSGIHQKLNKIMATEAELDAAIADLKSAIADKLAELQAKIDALSAGNPDLSDEIADINATTASLRTAVAPA